MKTTTLMLVLLLTGMAWAWPALGTWKAEMTYTSQDDCRLQLDGLDRKVRVLEGSRAILCPGSGPCTVDTGVQTTIVRPSIDLWYVQAPIVEFTGGWWWWDAVYVSRRTPDATVIRTLKHVNGAIWCRTVREGHARLQ